MIASHSLLNSLPSLPPNWTVGFVIMLSYLCHRDRPGLCDDIPIKQRRPSVRVPPFVGDLKPPVWLLRDCRRALEVLTGEQREHDRQRYALGRRQPGF